MRRILWSLLAGIVILVSAYFHQSKLLEIHFVDEEDNFIVGKYLLQDKILYQDIFSQHQPLPYILSASIQKFTQPNSIYLLVKSHRQFIVFLSIISTLFLSFRFGWPFLGFAVIFELTKRFLFGNLFLAETLVIYPLIYLLGLIFTDKPTSSLELILSGTLIMFICFTLAPLWPLLILLTLLLLYKYSCYRKYLVYSILFWFLVALVVIPWRAYYHDIFIVNWNYYLSTDPSHPTLIKFIQGFFSPLTLWTYPNKFQALSALLSLSLFCLIKRNIYIWPMAILSILALANIRYVQPLAEYYRGFHLLPWSALFIILSFLSAQKALSQTTNFKLKFALYFLIFVTLINSLTKGISLFQKNDTQKDLYVNFSHQFTIGEAIRYMKAPNDTLFVSPDEALIYWQADILPSSRFVFYYPWMESVGEFNDQIYQMYTVHPPTFVYSRNPSQNQIKYLNSYYQLHKDGQALDLYVLPERYKSLTTQQKSNLNFHHITYPFH